MRAARMVCLLLLAVFSAHAADTPLAGPLRPGDEARLHEQRQLVADLAARRIGRGLGAGTSRDLDTLQQLLERRIVRAGQTAELQAMGVVLGDLLAHELDMRWVIYEDSAGRSRALQLGDTQNFLFPVTMISRRVDAGLPVDVAGVYAKALAEMKPWIGKRYGQSATSR